MPTWSIPTSRNWKRTTPPTNPADAENSQLMEDTSELGEDDDDIGEVMEHVDDELDDKP